MFAALDVGGTKIAAGLVDGEGRLLTRAERPTPADAPETAVGELLDELAADPRWSEVSALGVGSAGPIDAAKGTVSPVNIAAWRDYPLVAFVQRWQSEVTLAGDGVAMAAGEHWRGAARGRDDMLGMVVSTGVGGGLVLGGRLHAGPSGNAGHIGHLCVELDGDPCPCGAVGCVEVIASGTAIAKAAGETSAARVADRARAGDAVALAAFDRAGRALAASIAGTAALVDIEVAVIGGGVAKAGEVLFGPVRRELERYARLAFTRGVEVLPAELGGDAGLIGAAALVAGGY